MGSIDGVHPMTSPRSVGGKHALRELCLVEYRLASCSKQAEIERLVVRLEELIYDELDLDDDMMDTACLIVGWMALWEMTEPGVDEVEFMETGPATLLLQLALKHVRAADALDRPADEERD